MKFKLRMTRKYFNKNNELDMFDMSELEKIGFVFKDLRYYFVSVPNIRRSIELNSLTDLIELTKKLGDLIIRDGTLEIYNDWRE